MAARQFAAIPYQHYVPRFQVITATEFSKISQRTTSPTMNLFYFRMRIWRMLDDEIPSQALRFASSLLEVNQQSWDSGTPRDNSKYYYYYFLAATDTFILRLDRYSPTHP